MKCSKPRREVFLGSVGQYELIQGVITGEVDPTNPQNAVIVDIAKAPRNSNGSVSYSSDFQIIRPINRAAGNHRILFDLPNRGGATALTFFNDGLPNPRGHIVSTLDAGIPNSSSRGPTT